LIRVRHRYRRPTRTQEAGVNSTTRTGGGPGPAPGSRSTGTRLRELRGRRSQKAIAELAGISQGYLSHLEHDRKRLDSRRLIARLADALGVSPGDILGQPWRPAGDPALLAAHQGIPALRRRLMDTEFGEPDGPSAPLAVLEEQVRRLSVMRRDCVFDGILELAPGLLGALHTLVARSGGAERGRGLQLIFTVASCASSGLRKLGYADLAWVAAQRAREAVLVLDDPLWIAASAFVTGHALICAGASARALAVTGRAGEQLSRSSGRIGGAPAAAVHGALLLAGSFAAATLGRSDEAADLLTEARAVAGRTGEQGMDAYMFGPSSVVMHEICAAVELGEGKRVLALSGQVDLSVVQSGDRRSSYWSDLARGLVTVPGQDHAATVALRHAEQAAPQRVRSNPFTRELVPDLLARARRRDDRQWLRGLAVRAQAPV
jgi:transcriptional regulator with XRE-family HTH domain